MATKKTITLELTELDVKIMLEALGNFELSQRDRRLNSKATTILIERVYRAMGVRL